MLSSKGDTVSDVVMRGVMQSARSRLGQKTRKWLAIALLSLLLVALLKTGISLGMARSHPVDTVLVLGGSIRREIHAADVAIASPQLKVLISRGSADPCIYLIFERVQAPLSSVWLEKCARSTFDNFFFSLPILNRWSARHVLLITSEGHAPRAVWMARVMLGAHGIWVEPDLIHEAGIPGNQESRIKTTLDMIRAGAWAIASQFYAPRCRAVTHLAEVDLKTWQQQGFSCEHQGQVNPP